MELFKTKDGKTVVYNNLKATVCDLKELEAEKIVIEKRLTVLEGIPDDKTLLAWAKLNYPFHDTSLERATLVTRLEEINSILSL